MMRDTAEFFIPESCTGYKDQILDVDVSWWLNERDSELREVKKILLDHYISYFFEQNLPDFYKKWSECKQVEIKMHQVLGGLACRLTVGSGDSRTEFRCKAFPSEVKSQFPKYLIKL